MSVLNEHQQQLVVEETNKQIRRAEVLFNKKFPIIPVQFDLRGHTIGMYKYSRHGKVIRYNSLIFAKYFDENCRDTIPHEVAHYIIDMQYGGKNVRPHGVQWRSLMDKLGADASRTANYDLSDIPKRVYSTVPYRCGCQAHQLGIRRHNKVVKRSNRYFCRLCGDILKAV